MNPTYVAFMAVAIGAAFALLRGTREPLGLAPWEKLGIGLGAFCGGMVGAKLPFLLADWQGFVSGAAWFDDGKTIMSGLVGGYLGAQVAEWALDIRANLGDVLAVPLAVGVGIGRLACFSAGCCSGAVTSVPWGVDFGDGLPRHPTQLYEAAFHLAAAAALVGLYRRGKLRGRLIQAYFVAYFVYRFATEFIRPEPGLWLGLTGYQWASLVLIPFFAVWRCPGCRPAAPKRWRRAGRQATAGDEASRVLKSTRTLCPECLRPLAGETYQEGGRIYLKRHCPEHGAQTALVSTDRRFYWLRDEAPHPPPAAGEGAGAGGSPHLDLTAPQTDAAAGRRNRGLPLVQGCCGGGPGHRTCVALLELTEACNLHCPVCFAGAQGGAGAHRPLAGLMADLEAFLAARGPLDVLQLSGGEPLLHPDLLEIIDRCRKLPIGHVMINTNGLELVRREGLAAALARRRPRLELFLQMDGLDAQSHRAIRGEALLEEKLAVLDAIAAHGLPATLVATLVRGVNEGQVGPLIALGLKRRHVRGIVLQPATFSGRFARESDPLDRLTLADVVRLVVRQTAGLFREDDFKPLPCSNPNCCALTVAVRAPGRPVAPLTRLVRYEKHLHRLADRMNFNLEDAGKLLGRGWGPEDFFRVVVKPFMDAHTYDRDRIDECCVHVIRPGGKAVSFCEFNILGRGRGKAGPALEKEAVHAGS